MMEKSAADLKLILSLTKNTTRHVCHTVGSSANALLQIYCRICSEITLKSVSILSCRLYGKSTGVECFFESQCTEVVGSHHDDDDNFPPHTPTWRLLIKRARPLYCGLLVLVNSSALRGYWSCSIRGSPASSLRSLKPTSRLSLFMDENLRRHYELNHRGTIVD